MQEQMIELSPHEMEAAAPVPAAPAQLAGPSEEVSLEDEWRREPTDPHLSAPPLQPGVDPLAVSSWDVPTEAGEEAFPDSNTDRFNRHGLVSTQGPTTDRFSRVEPHEAMTQPVMIPSDETVAQQV